MSSEKSQPRLLWAVILGLSCIASAWVLGMHWVQSKTSQRYVTVKGLAEQEVRADRASWSIIGNYGAQSTDAAQRLIQRHEATVNAFMLRHGFSEDEIKTSHINIYRNSYQGAADPFNVEVRVTVNTENVKAVESATSDISQLIAEGIVLSGDKWLAGPRYFFTNFQDIKPQMLAEATKNAKVAADEFAKNSGSGVGRIKYANQGVFQILPASRNNDDAEFYADKIIRVVTTVDYFLN